MLPPLSVITICRSFAAKSDDAGDPLDPLAFSDSESIPIFNLYTSFNFYTSYVK